LFRVRHLLFIYGVDVRDELLKILPLEKLRATCQKLGQDDEAIKILSTYAINYIYLVEQILFPADFDFSKFLQKVLVLGQTYNTTDAEQILFLIYLYTHCIIGESNFYLEKISHADEFSQMLREIESLIKNNYDEINLDNKCEFLVCARIVNYQTDLADRIWQECEESFAPEGDWVIDTLNNYKQSERVSFGSSEHRNVLLIMSGSDFQKS